MIQRRAKAAGITTQVGSGDGRHRLSEERRHARKSGADGEPCLDTDAGQYHIDQE
jgi:hypothetical protein